MPLVTTAELVAEASRNGRGVASFNVITLEHAEAIAAGAEAAGAAAVLQLSENAVAFRGGHPHPIAAAAAEVARGSAARLALHLDHVVDERLLRAAPGCGFSSVMFDGSALPYAHNVRATRAAVEFAHRHGLWVEAELGAIGGKAGSAHAPGVRTDPGEAAAFTAQTGVDALAVAVGSRHAMTEQSAELDFALIARLRAALDVPLVLHGSSGVPDGQLRRAVAAGLVKINIGTALNTAYTGRIRDYLAGQPAAVDPRRYLAPAREAMAAVVEHLLRVVAG